jgi:beta-N-acetylhexosaminidase
VAEGHIAGGVAPVVKHLPGHGRATADSHLELPRVTASLAELEAVDFEPFRRLNRLPAGMTAHIVFDALDPQACTTTSPTVITDIIRSHIGFDGLLMSDDLSMKALAGNMKTRTRQVIEAGCDLVLHCNGKMEEMTAVAQAARALEDRARERYDTVFAVIANPEYFDIAEATATLDNLFNMTAA